MDGVCRCRGCAEGVWRVCRYGGCVESVEGVCSCEVCLEGVCTYVRTCQSSLAIVGKVQI